MTEAMEETTMVVGTLIHHRLRRISIRVAWAVAYRTKSIATIRIKIAKASPQGAGR